jgi:hypothetical protein
MDKYFKIIEDGYISLVGTGGGDGEISQEEYETILSVIHDRPTAEPGYDYKLRTDLTWELCEVPVVEAEEGATEEDYLAALAE